MNKIIYEIKFKIIIDPDDYICTTQHVDKYYYNKEGEVVKKDIAIYCGSLADCYAYIKVVEDGYLDNR